MATVVSRLESVLSMNTRDFDRGADTSSKKMHKLGQTAGRAGFAIAGGLAVGLTASVSAAVKAEASQSRLEAAFKTAGIALTPYIKRIQEAEKAGRKLGFTDDDTHQALGTLIVSTKSYTVARRQLNIAQDIARFKGIELASATKLLTSASAGGQRALKQLGLSIQPFTQNVDKVKEAYRNLTPEQRRNTEAQYNANLEMAKLVDKHKTMNQVVELVRQKLKGQSQAYADTAAGGMATFKAQLDHLEVALGKGVLPAMTKVATALGGMATWLAAHPTLTKVLVTGLGALAAALIAVSVAERLAFVATPWGAAITLLLLLGITAYKFRDKLRDAFNWVKDHWPLLLGILTGPIGMAIVQIVQHRDRIVEIFKNLPGHIADAFSAGYHIVKDAITGLFGKVIGWVKDVLGIGSPSKVFHDIGVNVVKGFANGVGSAAGMLKKAVTGMVGDLAGKVGGFLDPHGGGPGFSPGRGGIPGTSTNLKGGDMEPILGAANAIDSKKFPYLWGGGHSGSTMNGPYDCSGAVSALLRAGGLMSGSMVSGDFMSYGKPGMGKHISILANPEHVYTLINGKAWGTSGQNPGGGAGWFSGGVRSGFAIRHPEGFDSGGWLKPGLTLAMNNTGRPERVLGPGEGGNFVFNFPNYVGSKQELMAVMREAAAQFGRRNNRPAFG